MDGVNGAGQQPTYALGFTVREWTIIRAGLYELPAKMSVQLIGKLEQFLMQAQNTEVHRDIQMRESME